MNMNGLENWERFNLFDYEISIEIASNGTERFRRKIVQASKQCDMIRWSTLRITNKKKQIMIDFSLFLNHFERIENPKVELTSELCFTGPRYHANI